MTGGEVSATAVAPSRVAPHRSADEGARPKVARDADYPGFWRRLDHILDLRGDPEVHPGQ